MTASVSRKEGNNKLALEGGAAYGRSSTISAQSRSRPPRRRTTSSRQSITSTNNYYGKGRYDRFFTANNAGYASGQAAADKIAGKTFFGGGQIGYSRQLYKSDMHLLVAELGYDFSYERYVQVPSKTLDPVVDPFGAGLRRRDAEAQRGDRHQRQRRSALQPQQGRRRDRRRHEQAAGVDAFKDTRVNGKLGLTTTLYKQLSIGFSFTLKYDQNPAPLPLRPANAATLDAVAAILLRRQGRHAQRDHADHDVPLGR